MTEPGAARGVEPPAGMCSYLPQLQIQPWSWGTVSEALDTRFQASWAGGSRHNRPPGLTPAHILTFLQGAKGFLAAQR